MWRRSCWDPHRVNNGSCRCGRRPWRGGARERLTVLRKRFGSGTISCFQLKVAGSACGAECALPRVVVFSFLTRVSRTHAPPAGHRSRNTSTAAHTAAGAAAASGRGTTPPCSAPPRRCRCRSPCCRRLWRPRGAWRVMRAAGGPSFLSPARIPLRRCVAASSAASQRPPVSKEKERFITTLTAAATPTLRVCPRRYGMQAPWDPPLPAAWRRADCALVASGVEARWVPYGGACEARHTTQSRGEREQQARQPYVLLSAPFTAHSPRTEGAVRTESIAAGGSMIRVHRANFTVSYQNPNPDPASGGGSLAAAEVGGWVNGSGYQYRRAVVGGGWAGYRCARAGAPTPPLTPTA